MIRCCSVLVLVANVVGHSSLISPRPFNAIDTLLPEFQGGKSPRKWDDDNYDCQCNNGTDVCDIGQTCYWFSNGCTIGCQECDGEAANPSYTDRCNSGMQATLNDARLRTYNRDVEAGSDADVYKHNPWRAPGNAPTFDPCGMASGAPQETPGHGEYTDTEYAKVGDVGSKLEPRVHSGATWVAGSVVEAAWSIRANHGGGYQYRLCPKAWPLTEACFTATPMPFAGNSSLLLDDGRRVAIRSTFVSEGTTPRGSTWAMNPIPYSRLNRNRDAQNPAEFEPPCEEDGCAGRWPMATIYDQLRVPAYLEPGEYVLGFRWDCEKSAQIWQSCADITISAAVPTAV